MSVANKHQVSSQAVWDVSAMPFRRCRFGDAVSSMDVSAMDCFGDGPFRRWTVSAMDRFGDGTFRRWDVSAMDVSAMGRFGDGTFWRWNVLAMGNFRWNILHEPVSSFHFWDLCSFIIPKILDLL